MEQIITSAVDRSAEEVSSTEVAAASPARRDDWQRRFGVPWERVDRAARAVLDRAAAASRRRFADLTGSSLSSEAGIG